MPLWAYSQQVGVRAQRLSYWRCGSAGRRRRCLLLRRDHHCSAAGRLRTGGETGGRAVRARRGGIRSHVAAHGGIGALNRLPAGEQRLVLAGRLAG